MRPPTHCLAYLVCHEHQAVVLGQVLHGVGQGLSIPDQVRARAGVLVTLCLHSVPYGAYL